MSLELKTTKKEPKWLQAAREKAFNRFQKLAMPTRKDELFKYTPVSNLDFETERKVLKKAKWAAEIAEVHEDDSALLVLETAEKLENYIDPSLKTKIQFTDLKSALKNNTVDWNQNWSSIKHDKFAQLNLADWSNGAFLKVKDNINTIVVIRLAQLFSEAIGAFNYQNFFDLGSNNQVILIDESYGKDGKESSYIGELSNLVVGKNTHAQYIRVQKHSANTQFLARQRISMQQDSSLEVIMVESGAQKSQHYVDINLDGKGANCDLQNATLAKKDQHFDLVANSNHNASHTTSKVDHWCVLRDRSKAVFNGTINVLQKAVHTDGEQKNHTLLLSREASIHAMPKLIIACDEVACAHGSSITQVDPEQLFYLESRGVDTNTAREMIIEGFSNPVLDAIKLDSLRLRVKKLLKQNTNEEFHD